MNKNLIASVVNSVAPARAHLSYEEYCERSVQIQMETLDVSAQLDLLEQYRHSFESLLDSCEEVRAAGSQPGQVKLVANLLTRQLQAMNIEVPSMENAGVLSLENVEAEGQSMFQRIVEFIKNLLKKIVGLFRSKSANVSDKAEKAKESVQQVEKNAKEVQEKTDAKQKNPQHEQAKAEVAEANKAKSDLHNELGKLDKDMDALKKSTPAHTPSAYKSEPRRPGTTYYKFSGKGGRYAFMTAAAPHSIDVPIEMLQSKVLQELLVVAISAIGILSVDPEEFKQKSKGFSNWLRQYTPASLCHGVFKQVSSLQSGTQYKGSTARYEMTPKHGSGAWWPSFEWPAHDSRDMLGVSGVHEAIKRIKVHPAERSTEAIPHGYDLTPEEVTHICFKMLEFLSQVAVGHVLFNKFGEELEKEFEEAVLKINDAARENELPHRKQLNDTIEAIGHLIRQLSAFAAEMSDIVEAICDTFHHFRPSDEALHGAMMKHIEATAANAG